MNKDTVVLNRENFMGGSDIPVIMGISKFKSRWELLQFKAGLVDDDFNGNVYTEYGDTMEPKIRDYINEEYSYEFAPQVMIIGSHRGNTDGYDPERKTILEVKTTSQIHETLDGYKPYLVQTLFYMAMYGCHDGLIAVYDRPTDFDESFDPDRLHLYYVALEDWLDLAAEIEDAVDRFEKDLEMLRENPLLTEEDFIPKEITTIANEVVVLEDKLKALKKIEKEAKELKADLKAAMEAYGITKWETYNGIKITLVADGEDSIVDEFDEEAFKNELPETYKLYVSEKVKKGKKGYVKITLPKGE